MATPSLDQIITEIDQWFSETMHGSVVAREVAVYNHVHAAYQELKSRIAAAFTGKPAPVAEASEEPAGEAPVQPKTKPAA